MAVVARSCPKGRVDIRLEELRVLRGVRVVTAHTVHHRRIDIDMGVAERSRLEIMALPADVGHRLQKQVRLGREMRTVAGQTVARGRWMVFLLAHPLFQIFMAGQTHVGTLHQKELAQFRLVRVMALGACPGLKGRMFAFCLAQSRSEIGVALEAEDVLFIHQNAFLSAAVRIMAGQTQPVHKGLMVRAAGNLFHEIAVALYAELRILGLKKFRIVGAVAVVAGRTEAARNRLVDISLEEFCLGVRVARITNLVDPVFEDVFVPRAVRIVTGNACLLGKRRMGILEFLLFHFRVALEAQLSDAYVEQVLVLCGMRPVARETALLAFYRRVGERNRCPLFRVAAHTEIVDPLEEQPVVIGIMRIMT